ncbi:unnamed protein product, partial [Effrenium voratum]
AEQSCQRHCRRLVGMLGPALLQALGPEPLASLSVDVPEVPATARGRMPQWKLSVRKKMYELKGKLDERHPESMTLQVLGAAMGFLEALPEELLVVQQRLQVDSPLTPQGMLPVALLKWGCSTVLPDDLCAQDEVLQ